ncbi:PDZ domain-containing protein [Tsuneonella dongtanensis]|uniref:PDZ domain-containing protein n=1 Tax=Tsuneonella dongtanensis TaxID=692370 RepID=UPI0018DDD2E6|nr:PDZ domain-containing protein [Tsuneonella dongtanensis]
MRLQAEDLRLQSIGWRLATGNAAYCDARPAIGLLLQDMANYTEPARMRAAAGIAGDIAVQVVVPGSPAARAGLDANAEILAIDGRSMADLPPVKAGDWQRLTALHDGIDAALAANGKVRIAWRGAEGRLREETIAGVPACPSRFELLDSGGRAVADGKRVLIGRKFAGFEYGEDEIAAAIAHEFAHNLLSHKLWLRKVGRKQKNIRTSEREADRMMPWLLANAGYDPQAAVRFFERWGPGNDGWIFRARTHDGWDERAEGVAAEIEGMQSLVQPGGQADWRRHFRRETGS